MKNLIYLPTESIINIENILNREEEDLRVEIKEIENHFYIDGEDLKYLEFLKSEKEKVKRTKENLILALESKIHWN